MGMLFRIFPIVTANASLRKAGARAPLLNLTGETACGLTWPRHRSVSRFACVLERRVQQALRSLSIADLHVRTREVRKQNGGNSILGGTDVYHARLHFMASLY